MSKSQHPSFELSFRPLARQGRGLAFPCDSAGRVDLDSLSDRVRDTYFYARTVIGREFALPTVRVSDGMKSREHSWVRHGIRSRAGL